MHTAIPRAAVRRIVASALAVAGLVSVASGLVLAVVVPAHAESPGAGCQSVTSLDNGGFETPVIPDSSYSITPVSTVPGWESTDPSGIEVWSSGFQDVPAAVGRQFAELNATQAGTLFQEVATQPGQALQWSLLHRGRGGTDVMDVLIGARGGDLLSQGELSDGTLAWGRHTGVYIVPAGQTVTRFGFRAVSTGSGDNSIGNFLDDISFGTGACVVSTSSVSNTTRPGDAVHVGDVVEYAITAENQGGSRAMLARVANVLPVGLEFVTGSLATTTGPSIGGKTDAALDDSAEYTERTGTVTTRLGAGATATDGGTLAPQESTTFVFRARVSSIAVLSTMSIAFTVEYTDSLSGNRIVASSPAVLTPAAAAVDTSVLVTADGVAPVAGSSVPATFTIDVSNAGPQNDSAVTVAVTVPTQLTGATVTTADGGFCPSTGGIATCMIGDLGAAASARIMVAGTIDEGVLAGAAITVTATVTGAVFDSDVTNNASSATVTVTTDSDLWMAADDEPTTVYRGTNARMRFTVGNTGSSTARDVVMQVELPEGFEAVASAGTIDGTGLWSMPALASGGIQTVSLRGRATQLGRMSTAAWLVSSSTSDSRAGNERAVASIFVDDEPRVPLVGEPGVVVSPAGVEPGVVMPPVSVDTGADVPSAVALPQEDVPHAAVQPEVDAPSADVEHIDANDVSAASTSAAVLASTGAHGGRDGAILAVLLMVAGLGLWLLGGRRRPVGARHRARR